jgi:hypothetical protein
MTRKCGKCGIAAPDEEAVFCNRCGSEIIDEPEPDYPLCSSCGTIVSDELAEFCNRCGSRIPREPVPVVCPGCGVEAIDTNSLFCTRCGTPFETKKKPAGKTSHAHHREPAPSVVVKPRRTAVATPPPREEPVPEWDPWSDDAPESGLASPVPPMPQKKYGHLPLVAEELARPQQRSDQQIAMPSKKYGHLPLIADELKDKGSRAPDYADEEDFPPPPAKGRKPPQKKGMMGLFKK